LKKKVSASVSVSDTETWFRSYTTTFPPSKLLLKNDEFNVKYAPGFSYLPTALSRTAWFVIPHQTLTTCLFSKDVRRIDKSQPTRRQQSKEPTTDFVLSRHHLWTELWVVLSYWGEVWIYIYFSKLKKEKCTYLSRILSRINFHNKVMFCMYLLAWPHFWRTQLHSPPNGDFCLRIWTS
jgi:hypothetical protein